MCGAVLPGGSRWPSRRSRLPSGFFAPDLWLARRRRERAAEVRARPAGAARPARRGRRGWAVAAGGARRGGAPLARAARPFLGRDRGVRSRSACRSRDALEAPPARAATCRRSSRSRVRSSACARHGAPLSDTLAAQAHDVRLARRRAIQEEAARAGPKMQLVVALLLVPSVMLLVAAALLSARARRRCRGRPIGLLRSDGAQARLQPAECARARPTSRPGPKTALAERNRRDPRSNNRPWSKESGPKC